MEEEVLLKTVRKIFKVKMMGKTLIFQNYASCWLIGYNIFDRTQWLYDNSDVIFPSVYMTEKTSPKNRPPMVRGRVKESMRLSRNVKRSAKPMVIVYHRYKFTDSLQYLSEVSVSVGTTNIWGIIFIETIVLRNSLKMYSEIV